MGRARQTPARRLPPRPAPPSPAPSRQSRAFHRREEQAREQRLQRRVTIGAAAVLLIAAIIVGAGYVIGDYLPRHARVLTVGDHRFEAERVAKYAALYAIGGENDLRRVIQRNPAKGTLDQITREETVLQAGASLVDAVSDAEVEAAIRKQADIAAYAPQAQYATSYAAFIAKLPITKAEFERTVRAGVIAGRMIEKNRKALPDEGVQVRVEGEQSPDRSQVQRVRDDVTSGTDFAVAMAKGGLSSKPEDLDIGWHPLDALDEVKDALASLRPGEVSGVVALRNGNWGIYRVVERDDRKKYEDGVGTPGTRDYQRGQKDRIAEAQLREWVDGQGDALHTKRELSKDREAWILKRTQAIARDLTAAAQKAATP